MKATLNLVAALVCFSAACSAAAERPNIVVLLLDNVGQEWFRCYGSEENCTPNIDRLAAGGVRFSHCYTTTVCGPSRVELLTGRYPLRTGWYLHHDAALYSGGGLDPQREVTFARLLRDAGYATGMAGKWQVNNLYAEPDAITRHGFNEYLVWPGSIDRDKADADFQSAFQTAIQQNDHLFLTEATRKIESRYWDPVTINSKGERQTHEGAFGPDLFQQTAVDFVRKHKDRPFVFYHAMPLVHGQNMKVHVVSTPDNRAAPPADEHAAFADMLRYADKQVGALVHELEVLDLMKRTIVIVASDNGTEKTLSARANSRLVQGGLYQINEAGGDVALIAYSPDVIPAGRTGALADFTDILPTICDFAGVAIPKNVVLDGKSQADYLRGKAESPREWIFNHYAEDRVVRDHRFKLNQKGELYDLQRDPDEQRPLSSDSDPQATEARVKLQSVLDRMPPSTPLPFPYRSLSAFKKRAEAAEPVVK